MGVESCGASCFSRGASPTSGRWSGGGAGWCAGSADGWRGAAGTSEGQQPGKTRGDMGRWVLAREGAGAPRALEPQSGQRQEGSGAPGATVSPPQPPGPQRCPCPAPGRGEAPDASRTQESLHYQGREGGGEERKAGMRGEGARKELGRPTVGSSPPHLAVGCPCGTPEDTCVPFLLPHPRTTSHSERAFTLAVSPQLKATTSSWLGLQSGFWPRGLC